MSDKLKKFIFNLKWPICISSCGFLIDNKEKSIILVLIALIFLAFNIIEYFATKIYKPIGQLHPNASEKEKQDALSGSTEDRFINEVLGYASTLGLNPTLDFSNGAMTIIDYDIEKNLKVAICALIFPDSSAKYGSDKYKSAVAMMKEQIDAYIEDKTTNKDKTTND